MRRSALVTAASLALAWAGAASAQQKRPLVAEDLYRLRFASDVTVSPDGRWVVYVVSRADSARNRYERELWLAAADGSSRRQLTYSAGDGAGSPAVSPDGRTLAFTARRQGDERPQLYLLPLDRPGEARRVTTLETGASDPVWSPDGTRIAFTSALTPKQLEGGDSAKPAEKKTATTRRERLALAAEKGDPHVVTRLAFLAETGLAPERWGQIYVVDVTKEGAKPVRITSGAFPHSSPSWSPDGKWIAFSARPPKGDWEPDYEQDGDIWLVAADGSGEPRNLTGKDAPPEGVKPLALPGPARAAAWDDQGPVFSPDGKRIAYVRSIVGEHESAANNEVTVLDLDGPARRCVSCALDRSARSPTWDRKTGELLFSAGDRGSVVIYRARLDGSAPKPIVSGPRGALSFDLAGGTLAWSEMNPSDPSEVFAARADGSSPRRLTQLNDSLLAAVFVQPYEEMWYRAPDGTRVQGWIVRPPDFKPGMPLAVEMHGGPHSMWGPGEQSMWLEYQTLAGDGYVVFFSNPRGSDGYGFEWKKAIHDNWGELPMGDVLAGADSVIARGWADPNRQYLTGGSYAGYLTAWIIGHTNRFKAAAAQRGVFEMTAWYGMANTWRLFESEFGTVPWQDHEKAWKASPLAYASNMQTPLLILHGEEDRRVGMGGAEALYKALKVQGKEVEFVRYPREGHELTRSGEPHHRVDHMNRIVDWFDRHRPDLASTRAAGTGH